jgi:hypothetical protein
MRLFGMTMPAAAGLIASAAASAGISRALLAIELSGRPPDLRPVAGSDAPETAIGVLAHEGLFKQLWANRPAEHLLVDHKAIHLLAV